MNRSVFAATIFASFLWTGFAGAEFIRLGATKDNTLFESETGALSNGAGPNFFVGSNSSLNRRRGVIAFDVAALPAGAVVDSVILELHVSNAPNGITQAVTIHRMTADWGEGSSSSGGGGGAASTDGDATWIHRFFPGMPWAAPGGDFDPEVHAETMIGGVGYYAWSDARLAADVQAWLDTPAVNFGWVLHGAEDVASSARRFDARENETEAFRPALTVYYSPDDTPVERSTWSRVKRLQLE